MAGSHEVRGSIPLGSTTDPRGARRRRRAPLFCFRGRKGLIGQKACLIQGRRRGPAPLSRSPGLVAPFKRPDGKRAPVAHRHREVGVRAPAPRARRPRRTRSGASRQSAAGRGRIRRLAASAPPSSKGPRRPREDSRPKAAQKPSTESGRIRIRRRVREPRHRRPAGGARRPEAPLPRGGPRGDAAIEPANGAPKKGPIYRRASAGLGRLRREPDPCARRRGGARTHPARGCMGPAGFGNAGSSP